MITAIIMMFVVGAVLGLILGIASNVFKVEVDERVEKVTAMLPGYNCGSCGFAGCSRHGGSDGGRRGRYGFGL